MNLFRILFSFLSLLSLRVDGAEGGGEATPPAAAPAPAGAPAPAPTESPAPPPAGAPAPAAAPAPTPAAAPAPADAPPAIPANAEAYTEFSVAEGAQLQPGVSQQVKALAAELKLSQADAQKLYDKGASIQAANQQAMLDALTAQRAEWKTAAQSDKEFGGDAYDANQAVIAKGRDALASPDLVKLLDASGLGDHPEMLRLFFKAGKQFSQDTPFSGGRAVRAANPADSFYESMAKPAT